MRSMRLLRIAALLAWVPGMVSAAVAQSLVDPTRPPAGLADMAGSVAVGGPVLQSVMLSPGRKMAVISGEAVVLGGRYGEARLVRLTESEAVLKNGDETTVLKLYPQVEKRMTGGQKTGSPGNVVIKK